MTVMRRRKRIKSLKRILIMTMTIMRDDNNDGTVYVIINCKQYSTIIVQLNDKKKHN